MQKTFKLGLLGRFVVMYFAVILMCSVLSPVFQIVKTDAATATESVSATQNKARADLGDVHYTIPSDFGNNILGVNAVYYDYISDEERSEAGGKWLHPQKSGTGHSNSSDDWFPFYVFNQKIASYSSSNPSWDTPLYFGNFCNTWDAWKTSDHGTGGGYWNSVTNWPNANKFVYEANNSNGLDGYNVSYQGLMHTELVDNQLAVNSSVKAPYFDHAWLKQNNIAKIIQSEFPFRIEDKGGYKEYSFTSKNAKDNVYFTWKDGNVPTKVNYSSDSQFGVEDGIKYFMKDEASGKGIFPFNNASNTNKGSKDSNENLNYGFGIRMDIDFRVPKNGLIPNTNEHIKFEFTGDDDLWVYITDQNGNSQLVLDMGGAHKESHGVIDFNTKTATVDFVHPGTEYGTSTGVDNGNYITVGDYGNWGSDLHIWAWGDGEGEWYDGTVNGKEVLFAKNLTGSKGTPLSHQKQFKIVRGNWSYETQAYNLNEFWGKITYTDNMGFWKDNGSSSSGASTNVVHNFDFDNSNDQNTYTMTVFYMERGLIESNMSINFTMTPLTNDLEVTKKVNTAQVNKGLANELVNNEKFTYTMTSDNAPAANKAYTHTTSSGSTTSDGKFYLKDGESARFDSQFTVGSAMKVVENTTSASGISYTASYKLTDKAANALIKSESKADSSFNYINKANNKDSKTSLRLDYTNTPKVQDLKVTKNVVDTSGKDITSTNNEEFTFNIALDIYEEDKFNAFDLEYTVLNSSGGQVATRTATGGEFKLKAGQSAVFKGIPVGAKYKITEQVKTGYSMDSATVNGASTTVSGNTVSGDIKDTTANAVVIKNKYTPASVSLSATKKLDGYAYTGEQFTFKLTGLPARNLDGVQTKNTSTVSVTTSTSTNGQVVFENTADNAPFTYGEVGTYCYKIEEVAGDSLDYVYDTTPYYAKVVVTSVSSTGTLMVSAPKYYTDANFTQEVTSNKVVFNNRHATCELRVVKKNFNKTEVLHDAEFKIFAAKEDGRNKWVIDENSSFEPFTSAVTNHNGSYYAEFKDLPQGEYIVIETRAPQGYELSDAQMHVTVKKTAENNGVITVDFSDNGITWLPKAGGMGVTIFAIIGIACLLTSFAFLSIQSRKERKAYSGRHFR